MTHLTQSLVFNKGSERELLIVSVAISINMRTTILQPNLGVLMKDIVSLFSMARKYGKSFLVDAWYLIYNIY